MPASVLVVDAIATNRILLKVKLNMAYHRVFCAEGVADALPLLRIHRPHIVVAGKSASSVIQAIRSDPAGLDVPIISVGNEEREHPTVGLLRAGADEVLPSPVDEHLLLVHIRRLLKRRDDLHDSLRNDKGTSLWGLTELAMPEYKCTAQSSIAIVGKCWKRSNLHLDGVEAFESPSLQALFEGQKRPDGIFLPHDTLISRNLSILNASPDLGGLVKIVVASRITLKERLSLLDLGADAVIDQNIDQEEVNLRISRLLKARAKRHQRRQSVIESCIAASTDPLTGMANRRSALRQLDQLSKEGTPFSLLMIDVDHFKSVNDTYGHPGGDRVLIALSRLLSHHTKKEDICARIGGEEFLIILKGAAKSEAEKLGQKLCSLVNRLHIPITGKETTRVSISLGLASTTQTGEQKSSRRLLERVDEALYSAKRNGRNQVSVA